jgi:hypothetical protein
LRPQIIDGGLEEFLFLSAIENGHTRALRFEQERGGGPAQAGTENGDILVFVAQLLPQFQCRQAEQGKDD